MFEQARDGHFLLVAARELADWLRGIAAFHAQLVDPALRRSLLTRSGNPTASTKLFHFGQGQIVGDGLVEHQALLLAIFAKEPDSLRPSGARRGFSGRCSENE